MRSRRNNNINIKDYIVPIFIFALIFFLIYIAFFKSSDDDVNEINNQVNNNSIETGINIIFGNENTNAELIKPNNKKFLIESGDILNIGDSLFVKKGNISFNINNKIEFNLDKNGKIKYLDDSAIKLDSSFLWIDSDDEITIEMRYARVILGKDTTVNLEQTEVGSTVYLLRGKVEVINNGGQSTFLSPGTKINISSKNSSSKELDMNLLKNDFDDFFKTSPWFLKNNGTIYLDDGLSSLLTSTSSLSKGKENMLGTTSLVSELLNFDNIYDEGSITTPITNISGKFADNRISEIYIAGKKAIINAEKKTFNLVGVNTGRKTNDIVIKIFDKEGKILSKYVYTLYYSLGKNIKKINNGYSKINQNSYPVNGSDFIIYIPSVKDGKTTSSENTFFGTVKNPNVAYVTINGYKLKTFNGKTFRYHAYTRFKNLGDGINNYEIKYFGANGKVILKKYITINKESKKIKN